MNKTFHNLFPTPKPLIGMIHLPASPGYKSHPGMHAVIEKALNDLHLLEKAGYQGVLVENDNDQPHQVGVNRLVVEAFESVMREVVAASSIPVGMEIIYDMPATVISAMVVGADFVRLDVFADSVKTKWGIVQSSGQKINSILSDCDIKPVVLTDVHVKHAHLIEAVSLSDSIKRSIRLMSDAIIITGDWTGMKPEVEDLTLAKSVDGGCPVLIGSGLNYENAKELMMIADGAIVGTSIKSGVGVDFQKAKDLAHIVNNMR